MQSETEIRQLHGLQFRQNTSKDGADVMFSGRVFQSLGPATADDRSPKVTSHGSEEVDNATQCSRSDKILRCSAMDSLADNDCQFKL